MKKITFLGGGSLRILPIVRAVLAELPEVMEGSELRLLDLNLERAEAVSRMIQACPEYRRVNCKIVVTTDTDSALEGTDILYLTMAALREPSEGKAVFLSNEYNYIWSDQLSINGAFLALRLGDLILSLAKKLEKLSPKALMLIFPNPVSVYSCMVNTYTKVNALGICGGFNNHRWDLTRLCGRDGFDKDWNVVVAGVNHCSFILRGEYHGKDLYSEFLPEALKDFDGSTIAKYHPALEDALMNLYTMYRKYKTMLFSTEGDGLSHIFQTGADLFMAMEIVKRTQNYNAAAKIRQEEIRKNFADFAALSMRADQLNWNEPSSGNISISPDKTDIMIPILKAMDGQSPMRIVASRPNNGAVQGLPDHAALEYSMDMFKDTIKPVENLYIPSPFKGLISSLSEFQTLQADAIGQRDPALFAAALDAYPVHQFSPARKDYFRKMFDAYDDLDPIWRKSLDYLL